MSFINKALKLLSPEMAHTIALKALSHGIVPLATQHSKREYPLLGFNIPSLVGISGGADKNAIGLPGWSKLGVGMVEVGTVTLAPRSGNQGTRVWRIGDDSVVNWMGLPGEGALAVKKNLETFRRNYPDNKMLIGVSLAAPDAADEDKPAELGQLAEHLSQVADFITINESCPNVAGHGANQQFQAMQARIGAVKSVAKNKHVLIKLAPTLDHEALIKMVDAAREAGANGFEPCNTVPYAHREVLGHYQPNPWPHNDQGVAVGGYSGPGLLSISCFMTKTIREHVGKDVPIIGVGGVQSGRDALMLLQHGADAIQLYTGLITHGPDLIAEINEAIANGKA